MIFQILSRVFFICVIITLGACGFKLSGHQKTSKATINYVSSTRHSIIPNIVKQKLHQFGVSFSQSAKTKIICEQANYSDNIISTNAISIIREIRINISATYKFIHNNKSFDKQYVESVTVIHDNVNVINNTEQINKAKVRLAEQIASYLLDDINRYISNHKTL